MKIIVDKLTSKWYTKISKINQGGYSMVRKIKEYKGFVIAEDNEKMELLVFTKEEWSYGEGCRTPEFVCGSFMECKENIDSYNTK